MSLRAPPARGRARSWRGAASPVFVLVPGRLGPLARAGGHGSGRTSEAARDEADLGAVRSRRIVAVHGEIAMALGGRPLFARALFRAASASSSRQSTAHISARANSHSTCGVIRRRKVANDRYNIGVTSGSSTFPPGGSTGKRHGPFKCSRGRWRHEAERKMVGTSSPMDGRQQLGPRSLRLHSIATSRSDLRVASRFQPATVVLGHLGARALATA